MHSKQLTANSWVIYSDTDAVLGYVNRTPVNGDTPEAFRAMVDGKAIRIDPYPTFNDAALALKPATVSNDDEGPSRFSFIEL